METEIAQIDTPVMSQTRSTSPESALAVNTSALTGAALLKKLLVAAIFIGMARTLGPEVFGAYETALSLVYPLVLFVDLGTSAAIVRSVSDPHQDTNAFVGTALFLKMGLAVVVYPSAILMALIVGYSPLIVQLTAVLSIFSAAFSVQTTLEAVLQVHQRMVWLAVTQVLGAVVYAGAGWLILVSTMSVSQLAWAQVAGALVTVACLWIIIKKFRLAQPRLRVRSVGRLIVCALPFGLALLVSTWRFRIDILLLTALANEVQAGVFSASNRILGLLLLLPMAFSYALTPVAFESGRKAGQALELLCRRSLFASMAVGIPAAAGMFFIAEPVVRFIFGAEYASRFLPLLALSWCLPCIVLSSVAQNTLWGGGREYTVPLFLGTALIANVAIDLLLIPTYGAWGAALGALVGQLVAAISALTLVRLILFRIRMFSLLWAPILSSAVMLAALYGLRGFLHDSLGGILMEVALGAAIYTLVLLGLARVAGLSNRDFWPQLRRLR